MIVLDAEIARVASVERGSTLPVSLASTQCKKQRKWWTKYTIFFNKNIVFPAQAEYSYFSADFRLKIFL